MALDPSVPLSAIRQGPLQSGPADWMAQAYSIKGLMQQDQLRAMQLREAQRAQQEQMQISQASQQGGNPEEVADRIFRINPEVGMKLKKALADAQSADFDQKKKAFDFFTERNNQWKRRLGTVLFAPPDQQQVLYQQTMSEAIRDGLVDPSTLPPQFDPEWAKAKALETLQFDKQMSEHRAQIEGTQKQAKAPFELREQIAKTQTAEQEAAGTTPITPYQQAQLDKEKADTNINTVELALRAARGDPEARRALELLHQAQQQTEPGSYLPLTDEFGRVVGAWNPKSGGTATVPAELAGTRRAGMSAAERLQLGTTEVMLEDLKTLERLANANKKAIGPIQGRIAAAKRVTVGESDEVNEMFRLADNMADQLLRARSGAQINEQEYARLRPLVPNPRGPEGKFFSDLKGFRSELERILAKRTGDTVRPPTTPARNIRMRAPNGQIKEVPPDQVEHYKSLGAVEVR